MYNKRAAESLGAGLFLIGLGILFLVPGVSIWPWILVVIGVSGLPAALGNRQGWYGLQGFFWLAGLAILFATGLFWPGILILAGISSLVGALTRDGQGSPFGERRSSGEETRRLDQTEDPFATPPSSEEVPPDEAPPVSERRPTRRLD
jgi:hypothetical protein